MPINYSHGDVVEFEKTSVALGTFDGLHVAHMKIINGAREFARRKRIKCGIMMFDTIPANIIGSTSEPLIMKPEDRYRLLPNLDFIYTETFDESFAQMSAEMFVKYLKDTLKAEVVCVGYNYRFGKGAKGDARLLKSLCDAEGISVFIIDRTEVEGDVVSSTRIRALLQKGKVKEAEKLLNRPFFITGMVNHGFGNGHKMGIPTANLPFEQGMVQLKEGVYAGFCTVEGVRYKSVINVGSNPTFNGDSITIECHLLDYNGNLYNKEIKVEFIEYIRGEIKFNDTKDLVNQIQKDIEYAKNL